MTKYRHDAEGLDLEAWEPFEVYRSDLDDRVKYPRNWLKNAAADEITALGFVAYEPEPVPEPEPTIDEQYPPLLKYQFDAMIDFMGLEAAIIAELEAMPDGMEKSLAKALFKNGDNGRYHRSSPLLTQIAASPSMNITEDALNAAWMTAGGL